MPIPRIAFVAVLLAPLCGQEPPSGSGTTARQKDDLRHLSSIATNTDLPLERLPSTVTILSGDEIRRSGVRFLPDALRMLPGVEVMRTSATEVHVNVRGYNAPSSIAQGILALLDGRQVYNAYFGMPVWDSIPADIEELDRVEVLLGPGSFVHGPNAMHGVVNIVTKSPLDYGGDYFSLGAAAGSYGSATSRLVAVRREADLAVKTTLVADDIERFEPAGNNASDKMFGEVRLESLIGENDPLHRVDVTFNRSKQDSELLIPALGMMPPVTYKNDYDEMFVRLEYQNHGLRARGSWTGLDFVATADRIWPRTEIDVDTVDLDVQHSAEPFLGHHLTVGTGVRESTFRTRDLDVGKGRQDSKLGWLYLQDQFDLQDDWFVTAGLRYDYHSEAGPNLSPRLALVWEFDRNGTDDENRRTQSLRASYGQGFRYPSLRELYFDIPLNLGPVTIPFVGNLELEPERLQSTEIAYTGTFGESRIGLTGYYNVVENLVGFVAAVPATYANEADEETYGFEIDGEHRLNRWLGGFGNYSYVIRQDSDDREPRHKFNLGLRGHVSTRSEDDPDLGLHASLWLNYFDRTVLAGKKLDSYLLLNAHVSYDFLIGGPGERSTKGRVFVQAFNLLDNDHREHPDGDEFGLMAMAGFSVTF